MRITYNKLVRDKVVGILMQEGKNPEYERQVDFERKLHVLFSKAREENDEVAEAVKARDINKLCEEVGDVIQTYLAIGKMLGLSSEAIERSRRMKLAAKGGFDNGDFLISAEK